jgi:hypothetical protein
MKMLYHLDNGLPGVIGISGFAWPTFLYYKLFISGEDKIFIGKYRYYPVVVENLFWEEINYDFRKNIL